MDFRWVLKLLSDAEYADVRNIKQSEVEVALRHESAETFERSIERVVCRAVLGGYGIASTDKLDKDSLKKLSMLALKQAKTVKAKVSLAPVKAEKGEIEHEAEKEFDPVVAHELLQSIREKLLSTLGEKYSRSELVISYNHTESALDTSEGTNLSESTPLIDITLYLIAKRIQQGFASRILGGRGGFEIVESKNWDRIVEELVERTRDGMKARSIPATMKWGRCKVILDSEATGGLVHELAHMLEADLHQKRFFRNLKVSSELEVVDDPTLKNGYGSYTWDDEGVKSQKKTLLRDGEVNLLHTRLTATEDGEPGNAHGIIHMPRPIMSNVYLKASDWRMDELFEDARKGVYARGVVRAECDTSDGRFELTPEISYLFERGMVMKPIKHLKVIGNIVDLIQRIDAIGRKIFLRPNIEKGFCISEGGPHLRVDGAVCL
ncbi:TldD/PmbA family protein [[Eubacterium] cellulosolvens]